MCCFQINPAEKWLWQSFCLKIHKDSKAQKGCSTGRAFGWDMSLVLASTGSVKMGCLCQPLVSRAGPVVVQHLSVQQLAMANSSQPTYNCWWEGQGCDIQGMHSHQAPLHGAFVGLCSPAATSCPLQTCLISYVCLQGRFSDSLHCKMREMCTPGVQVISS